MGDQLHHVWFSYVVPSLYGNGPEDLIRTAIAVTLAYVFIPQVRRFFLRGWDRLHKRFDGLHESHDEIHDHLHHLTEQLGLERFERKGKK